MIKDMMKNWGKIYSIVRRIWFLHTPWEGYIIHIDEQIFLKLRQDARDGEDGHMNNYPTNNLGKFVR